MRILPWLLAATFATAAAVPAIAGAAVRADVSVHDRRDGTELRMYLHEGRRYVVGEPGREYEIRIRSREDARVLAVTSVDGVNVLSGQTADPEQSGYVVNARGSTRIDGWRKNLSEVASFYFTRLPDSYAARTGRPNDVGVIGVALFREKRAEPCCRWWRDDEEDRYGKPQPSAAPQEQSRSGVDASAEVQRAEPPAPRAQKKSERLGTGHGERLDSAAYNVAFERASDRPDEVIAIYYDSRANLVAQGVIPHKRFYAQKRPNPFPDGDFVPDP